MPFDPKQAPKETYEEFLIRLHGRVPAFPPRFAYGKDSMMERAIYEISMTGKCGWW